MAEVRFATLGTLVLAASLPLAALGQSCVPDPSPDWMTQVPMSTSAVTLRPADCAVVEQTPPDFSWPDHDPKARYTVTLAYPDGTSRSLVAPQNWINWDEALPPGDYAWRVRLESGGTVADSRVRRFTVSAQAVPFVVPSAATLFSRAVAKPHPRALLDPATAQAMLAERQAGFTELYARVDALLSAPLPGEPAAGTPEAIAWLAHEESRRMLEAALAWLATWREEYFADALRRALNLAAWDPNGSTSYAASDFASREIVWSLALAYDWLHPWLDENQRSLLRAPILVRAGDMYNALIGSRARFAAQPYDSHGNVNLTTLALVCVLLAGDFPEAYEGLRQTLPLALHWTSPWGGEDGGYANGTAYAGWDASMLLLPWYALRWTVGVDIAQKAWTRNYARFLAYFLPPGTPAGAFGDGAELPLGTEWWASRAKSYAAFAPSALSRWYAAQLGGEDPSQLELLLAPLVPAGPAPLPAGTPGGAYFPSIGWAAMHSALADPQRTSVYFKSSRFASYNHSHADQNSLVVTAGGQPLAIDSGHFDGYKTPHWWQWYKQTRAHNAITFDGGQGQLVYEANGYGPGALTRFEHALGYDIVQGDATAAYGGALSDARRSLVYLRPDRILVYDRLASATPRTWEWNLHAAQAMSVVGANAVRIDHGGQSLCVDMLAGPEAGFTQTDQWSAEPLAGARQWHGTFASTQALPATEFIALLRVGCAPVAALAAKQDGVWT
ncbi:MAG TPA: DUF4962 domain-containing protein, partial [Burkholderiales bacterium]|nr:DUF4962 domain-containing protein [Burkholderiales bacterium]